ncbi:MAG: hypothetical protein IJO40_03830 [Thermoguttaceae bacterium]|nr:hypothetical protein [Thermoguttaceae bacterium]
MNECIQWCNANNGFLTALLALLSLFISVLAVIISVKTAKLPYKKDLLLKVGYQRRVRVSDRCLITQDNYKIGTLTTGLAVNATNVGNRPINLTFLGLGYYDNKKSRFYSVRKFWARKGTLTKKKQRIKWHLIEVGPKFRPKYLAPSESIVVFYPKDRLLKKLVKIEKDNFICAYAIDTEGYEYYCSFSSIEDMDANYWR